MRIAPSRLAVQMPLWLETIADPWDYEQGEMGLQLRLRCISCTG